MTPDRAARKAQERARALTIRRDRREKRRQLLIIFGAGGAAALAVGVPVVWTVLSPALAPRHSAWRDVGQVSEFRVGETVEVKFQVAGSGAAQGVSTTAGAWLRRTGEASFVCVQMNCTHLGCPVHWVPSSGLYLCPCHGGVFDTAGRNVAGPPRIPLRRHPVRVRNGRVEVLAQPVPLPGLTGPDSPGQDEPATRGSGS